MSVSMLSCCVQSITSHPRALRWFELPEKAFSLAMEACLKLSIDDDLSKAQVEAAIKAATPGLEVTTILALAWDGCLPIVHGTHKPNCMYAVSQNMFL
eukprot:scaffold532433_cov45-Prasinocladus_malaysianus.AAC.2